MSETEFKVGDLVRHITGGPVMAAAIFGKDGKGQTTIHCEWFNKDHEWQSQTFLGSFLRRYREPETTLMTPNGPVPLRDATPEQLSSVYGTTSVFDMLKHSRREARP